MKKRDFLKLLLLLLLVVCLVFSLAGCGVKDVVSDLIGKITGDPDEPLDELCEHTESEWITDTEPTCTAEGKKHRECTACGERLEDGLLDKLAHAPSDWIIDRVPTCSLEGERHKECTACGERLESDKIAVLSHTPGEWIVDAEPSCVALGLKHIECEVCAEKLEEAEIPKVQHTPSGAITENYVGATCSARGSYDEVVYCSVAECGALISRVSKTIALLPHTPGGWITDVVASCVGGGVRHKECTECHTMLETDTVPRLDYHTAGAAVTENFHDSTCTAYGYYDEVVYCSVAGCGVEMSRTARTVGLKSHASSSWIVDLAATCIAEGTKHTECTSCHIELSRETIPMLTYHTPGAPVSENYHDSTCTSSGTYDWVVYCSVVGCGAEISREEKTVTTKAHTPSEWIVDVVATCVAIGERHKECSVCHVELERESVPMLTYHTPAAAVIENFCDSTCTELGSYDEVVYCAIAGCCAEISRVAKTVALKDHSPSAWIVETYVTCTVDGVRYKKCTACHTELERETVASLGHVSDVAVKQNYIPATCTEDGSYEEVVYCAKPECRAEISRTPMVEPALGHKYESYSYDVEACGIDETYTVTYCTRCKTYTDSGNGVVLHPHSFELKIDYNAGRMWFECALCGYVIEDDKSTDPVVPNPAPGEDVEMHVHEYQRYFYSAPTCTYDGRSSYICECGHLYSVYYAALGHSFVHVKTNAEPTCTSSGSHTVSCSRCGYSEDRVLYAKGHNYIEIERISNPTCTAEGSRRVVCLSCGFENVESISALPHSWSVHTVVKESSCTEAGEVIYRCDGCGTEQTVYPGPLSHDEAVEIIDASSSCIDPGTKKYTCRRCGESRTETYYASHDMHAIGRKEATCTSSGYVAYSCSVCGTGETVTISALDHSYVIVEESDATCVDSGYVNYVCTRCNAKHNTEIAALGHSVVSYYDDTHHWVECSVCSFSTDRMPHVVSTGKVETEVVVTDGVITYYHRVKDVCLDCNYEKLYVNSQGEALGGAHVHYSYTFVSGKMPTCTEDGYTPSLLCAVTGCGFVYNASEVIPRLGHNYAGGNACIVCGAAKASEGLAYTSNGDGTCNVSAGTCTDADIIIPETSPDGERVTGIADCAFQNCTNLTSVTIPDSVTSIGNYAFRDCTGLTSVTIPDSVTSINKWAFYDCTSLTSVTVGNGVTSIGPYAFYNCRGLTSVIIPDSVAIIDTYAFRSCTGLASVTIGNGVTSIGTGAFDFCVGLTSVIIPDSVTSIGSLAFYNCDGIMSITIPDSVTSIGGGVFAGCTSLSTVTVGEGNQEYKNIDGNHIYTKDGKTLVQYAVGNTATEFIIPSGVESIGDYAFRDCTGLTSIAIPDSVTSIGSDAFYWCTGLTSITIPDSVTSIGSRAFGGCRNVITKDAGVHYVDKWVVDCDTDVISVTIRSDTVGIGDSAFRDCTGLTSVTIPDSVTSIGDYAFYSCRGLTSITIPNSVKSIGEYAFDNCTGLASVTIGNGVTSIGYSAFAYCTGLTSVTIPNSVTSVGDYAFSRCTGIEEIYFNAVNMSDLSYDDNVFYNAGKDSDGIKVTIGKEVTKIPAYLFDIPNSAYAPKIISVEFDEGSVCKSIGDYAFRSCTGLTSITIPDSVTSIGSYAFSGCTSLTSIAIGRGVKSMGTYAFNGCTGLEEIYFNAVNMEDVVGSVFNRAGQGGDGINLVIGKGVTRIPAGLFRPQFSGEDDINIVSVEFELGSVCESIGNGAFYKCTSLTSVTIPDSVTSIGDSAFYRCTGLASVTIGNGVTSIGNSAFYYCTGLTSVTIGNGVTSIGSYALYGCTSLTSVIIPKSVTSIGSRAFSDGTSLTDVYYTGTEEQWEQVNKGSSCLPSGVMIHCNYVAE